MFVINYYFSLLFYIFVFVFQIVRRGCWVNLGLGILLSAVHATTFIAEQKLEVVQFLFNQTLDLIVNTSKLLLLTTT